MKELKHPCNFVVFSDQMLKMQYFARHAVNEQTDYDGSTLLEGFTILFWDQ